MRKPNCKCLQCLTEIYRRPFQLRKGPVFCSKKCFNDYQKNKTTNLCHVCSKKIPNRQKVCSRECSNKHRTGIKYEKSMQLPASKSARLKLKLSKNGITKCQLCGFGNLNILQVHHIIKRSQGGKNEIENLKLLCPNCHATIHYGDSRKNGATMNEEKLLQLIIEKNKDVDPQTFDRTISGLYADILKNTRNIVFTDDDFAKRLKTLESEMTNLEKLSLVMEDSPERSKIQEQVEILRNTIASLYEERKNFLAILARQQNESQQ